MEYFFNRNQQRKIILVTNHQDLARLQRQRAQMAYLTGRKVRKGTTDGIKIPMPPCPLPWWWHLRQFKRFQAKHMN